MSEKESAERTSCVQLSVEIVEYPTTSGQYWTVQVNYWRDPQSGWRRRADFFFANFGRGSSGNDQAAHRLLEMDASEDYSNVGIAIISHPPFITIHGWYKPSNMGGLLLLYPHYGFSGSHSPPILDGRVVGKSLAPTHRNLHWSRWERIQYHHERNRLLTKWHI